jgi:hypothetical protein
VLDIKFKTFMQQLNHKQGRPDMQYIPGPIPNTELKDLGRSITSLSTLIRSSDESICPSVHIDTFIYK